MSLETNSSKQFLLDFQKMSEFGATIRGGVNREAGTGADFQTRNWFRKIMTDRGFSVRQDTAGNQFAMLNLLNNDDAPCVLIGSHLDSQPMAGRFDGAYGVLAAAHAAQRVAEHVAREEVTPKLNLAVVNWFNEEGSRFSPSMMGSSVYTGKMPLETALQTTDRTGTSVRESLSNTADNSLPAPTAASYAEIHVEQGRILEDAENTIGLVDATWAAKKYRITVLGEQGHTGSTLMKDRHDALYGAAKFIVAARELTEQFEDGALHSSVSELGLLPNSPVTIAREVKINLDLRSANVEVLQRAESLLAKQVQEIEQTANIKIEQKLTHEWGLVPYPPEGVDLAEKAVQELNLPYQRIMTVAGHDSTNMKDRVPTVMLFVPSVEGVSHHEAELTKDDDMLAGVDALTAVVSRLVSGELLSQ